MNDLVKNIFLLCNLLCIFVYANEGKMIYEKKCVSCHQGFVSLSDLQKNFLEMNNTLLNLTAPTLNQLSFRLKQQIGDPKGDEDMHRMEVGAFVADYVLTPNINKSICLVEVMKHFNEMPSMQGQITEEELEEVSNYIYDFELDMIKKIGVKYEGFDNALKRAKMEHKIIMIKVMSKECYYCKKMDREVFIEKEIVDALEKYFVSVSIDISTTKLPLGLTNTMTPSFVFVDEDSNILLERIGAWDKTDFLILLKDVKRAVTKNK